MNDGRLSERSIFEAAFDKGSPEERAAYLDQACGPNEGLRKNVEALLAAHDRLGTIQSAGSAIFFRTSVNSLPSPTSVSAIFSAALL